MKKMILFIRSVILSAFVLYGYNLIAVNFNVIIPINYFSLFFVTFLGAPALVVMVLFKMLVL